MSAVVRALENAPSIIVPEGFAKRVMARVPQGRSTRPKRVASAVLRPSVGRATLAAALIAMLAAMLLLAPRTESSPLWLLLQVLLFAQFGVFLLWYGLSRRSG